MAKSFAESALLSRLCVRPFLSRKPPSATFFRGSPPEVEPLGSSARDCGINEGRLAVEGRRGMLSKGYLPSIPSKIVNVTKGEQLGGAGSEITTTITCRRKHPTMTDFSEKYLKWWQLDLHPNMKQIESAQDLVDSLLNAENKLVIVDFFTPACRSCRALHPKICQAAEMNPDVLFLQINHEKHKLMCYTLNVHVLPFFRFYRGAHGRLCSFSCTNATIQKFKDALAKHTTDRCSLGPAKGMEMSELLALAANEDLGFNYTQENPSLAPIPDKSTPFVPADSR